MNDSDQSYTTKSNSSKKKVGVKESASPSNLQKGVEKGRAPKSIERVDKPHVPGQLPHVHYKDGTSSNNDGTIHDKHRGIPNVNNKTKKWLEDNGWKVK